MIRCLLLFPFLLIGGCGLAEYEAQMLDSQQRVERFDEENRLLGTPLQIPTKNVPSPGNPKIEVSTKLINVTIRPPKGIDPVYNPALWQNKFYQYLPTPTKGPVVPGGNIKPGQPQPGQPQPGQPQPGQPQPGQPQPNPVNSALQDANSPVEGILEVLLAWDDTDLETSKFSEEILKYFTSVSPLPPPLVRTVNIRRRPAFNCDIYDIAEADGKIYRVVIRKQNKSNLAVVYHLASGKLQVARVSRALDLSVESIFFLPETTAQVQIPSPQAGK